MSTQPLHTTQIDQLPVSVYVSNKAMGAAAAVEAAEIIRAAVAERGVANIIIATGNSQLTFLEAVRVLPDVPWEAVNVFHMDEYVNLPAGHPASFPAFLHLHLLDHIQVKEFFPVPGVAADTEAACRQYEALLRDHPADLCALGIGENGHLAFNDPPDAAFDDPLWVRTVKLDERSRRQQVGEGHFRDMDEVPTHAITVTIPGLLAAKRVLAIVPEARKADAVAKSLLGPITEDVPASTLRHTPHAQLFLDSESAADFLGGKDQK
jgi:glucosamine-6-phosphate deaminase